MASRDWRREARTFVLGAAYGFGAGALAVTLIAWQLGAGFGLDARSRAVRPDPAPTGTTGGPAPPPPPAEPTIAPPADDGGELAARDLLIPVQGVSSGDLVRSFADARDGGRTHEAIDILAPRDTPVVAVEDGTIARLFNSRAGGITIYQFDPTRQFCYYYAHLERYADGLREGGPVRRGQVIGYVGTSGNGPPGTPHLHFAVFRLGAEKRWWEGTPLDPFDVLR
jgi:murein DD-endopeptidase MepM/ murein hydrolase activator NlpD